MRGFFFYQHYVIPLVYVGPQGIHFQTFGDGVLVFGVVAKDGPILLVHALGGGTKSFNKYLFIKITFISISCDIAGYSTTTQV